jgi:invasion protein IalB
VSPLARITSAILCLLVALAGIGGLESSSAAKSIEQISKPARSARSGPVPPGAVPRRWRVHCKSTNDSIDCHARQSVYRKATGKLLISVAVRVPRRFEKPIMSIQLPLSIDIAYGALLQFGQTPTMTLSLQSCNAHGCFAEYALAEIDLAALIKGERLKISVRDRHRATFRYRVSGAGFAEAYAKIRSVAM